MSFEEMFTVTAIKALRGSTISLRDNPFVRSPETCLLHHEDTLVIIEDGKIRTIGPHSELIDQLPAWGVQLVFAF